MGAMTVLRPYLPFDPEETTLSFANRLALMHTGRGMRHLLRDLNISAPSFVSGHVAETSALAEMVGVEPEELLANSIDVKQTHVSFRDQRLARAFLSPRAARFCPACLAADGARECWRHRLIWGFRHVHRCDRHGLWLAHSGNASAEALPDAVSVLTFKQRDTVEDATPEYIGWLKSSLSNMSTPMSTWLEGQTLEQVLNASEMLGAVLEHGHGVKIKKLAPVEVEQATDIGFSIYREGPEAVTEALDTIYATSPASAVQAGPLAYYGALFDWLDRRANAIDPGPIRDILRTHITKHFAIEPGTNVLGEEITVRTAYSFQALSDTLGIHRQRLSRILQKLGKVPMGASDKESGRIVFDAAEILPLIEDFQTAINLHDIPGHLGASKRQVEVLYRAGHLVPLIPAPERGAVRQVVFSRRHLEQFLSTIKDLDELPDPAEGWHPVGYACQRGAGPFADLFNRIISGELRALRAPRQHGVASLRVHLDDVIG